MSKHYPIFRHPSHQMVVYNFRYHSHIPHTYTTNVFYSHRKQKNGLKLASQLITQIWRLIYGQWLHHSKLKHEVEELRYHAKELILDADITDKHGRRNYKLTERYNIYFGNPPLCHIIHLNQVTEKLVLHNQDVSIDDKHRQMQNMLFVLTPPHMGINSINTFNSPLHLIHHTNLPPLTRWLIPH